MFDYHQGLLLRMLLSDYACSPSLTPYPSRRTSSGLRWGAITYVREVCFTCWQLLSSSSSSTTITHPCPPFVSAPGNPSLHVVERFIRRSRGGSPIPSRRPWSSKRCCCQAAFVCASGYCLKCDELSPYREVCCGKNIREIPGSEIATDSTDMYAWCSMTSLLQQDNALAEWTTCNCNEIFQRNEV